MTQDMTADLTADLTGRVALVTGASRGLGFSVAAALGARGAHVIALARTVGGLEELDEAIQGAGGTATLVPLDLTDDPALERLGAAIHERWGKIDLWVQAAAHAAPLSPVEHIAAKELDASLAVNLRATQRLIRVLDPLLRLSDQGRAVFFHPAPHVGETFHGVYRASMAGQRAITESWARESAAIAVIHAVAPAMPTALRARFHPGEDRGALTDPAIVADRLMAHLAASAAGDIDLGDDGP